MLIDDKNFNQGSLNLQPDDSQDSSDDNHEFDPKHVIDNDIVEEVQESFLNYAMSVISSRALPDARDGLKPVQRRILYALYNLKLFPNTLHKKSSRVTGEVVGKYHPHGDSSVYLAIVLMAQNFTLLYPLVDGQGNFGSRDKDAPAAMRYTEVRMSKPASYLLQDIDKDTVDFKENYDGSEKEPTILPGILPGLLMNGSSGIAVGIATNMPPHNLGELIKGIKATIKKPEITTEELMKYIPAPDFPTGCKIINANEMVNIYKTGRGSIKTEGVYHIEETKRAKKIVITEIPYKVNKTTMIEKIASLINTQKINGISDIRDESNRQGIRLIIVVKNKFSPEVIVSQIIKHTDFRTSFPVNMMALIKQKPRLFNLKALIEVYIEHQRDVIRRATLFDLKKAQEKQNILKGFAIVLDDVDTLVKLIKSSSDKADACAKIIAHFKINEVQANAVLALTLSRLTQMERAKIFEELKKIEELIAKLTAILNSPEKIDGIIVNNLNSINKKIIVPRQTTLENKSLAFKDFELIPNRKYIITFTKNNYIKCVLFDQNYRTQRRGGVGAKTLKMYEDDFVMDINIANSHDTIYFITDLGRYFSLKVYDIPTQGKAAKGIPLVNILPKLADTNEKIISLFIRKQNEIVENRALVLVTKKSRIKKIDATILRPELHNSRQRNGKRLISLLNDDSVVSASLASDDQILAIATRMSRGHLTPLNKIRTQKGASASGVLGTRLKDKKDYIVSATIVNPEDSLLSISTKGYGKITKVKKFTFTSKNASGVFLLGHKTIKKTGYIVAITKITDTDHLLVLNDKGISIMIAANTIRETAGRSTKGVKIINLPDDIFVNSIAVIKDDKKYD